METSIVDAVAGLLPAPLQKNWLSNAPSISGSESYQITAFSSYLRRSICISVSDINRNAALRDLVTQLSHNDSLTVWLNQFQYSLLPSIVNGELQLSNV